MNKVDFVYIILHYKTVKDTFECIDSIIKINNSNNKIIILDNSQDFPSDLLVGKYSICYYYKMLENVGFAKANNLGISLCREYYNPDFYVVLNNDILLVDNKFQDNIIKQYHKYKFDCLGPSIFNLKGLDQNLDFYVLSSIKEIVIYLIKIDIKLFLLKLSNNILSFKMNKKNDKLTRISKYNSLQKPLHGSAIIFSRDYINKYNDYFFPNTFLFGEEDFLFYRVTKDKLTSIYTNETSVIHKEDKSTDFALGNNDKLKMYFILKNSKDSILKLLFLRIFSALRIADWN